jgi:hypothetical protein
MIYKNRKIILFFVAVLSLSTLLIGCSGEDDDTNSLDDNTLINQQVDAYLEALVEENIEKYASIIYSEGIVYVDSEGDYPMSKDEVVSGIKNGIYWGAMELSLDKRVLTIDSNTATVSGTLNGIVPQDQEYVQEQRLWALGFIKVDGEWYINRWGEFHSY